MGWPEHHTKEQTREATDTFPNSVGEGDLVKVIKEQHELLVQMRKEIEEIKDEKSACSCIIL